VSAEEKKSRGAAGGLDESETRQFFIFVGVKRIERKEKRDVSKIVFRGI